MKKYKLLKDLPEYKAGDTKEAEDWKAFGYNPDKFPEWFKETKLLFYTEDFSDGSFPKKSCNNCNYVDSLFEGKYFCDKHAAKECCSNKTFSEWHGELKGQPIYEGDKCWRVWKSSVTNEPMEIFGYHEPEYDIAEKTIKYFSNEENAKKYFNSLHSKIEIGKWYKKDDALMYCFDTNKAYGFNFSGCWRNGFWGFDRTEGWAIASDKEVEERLLGYAKEKFPKGTMVKTVEKVYGFYISYVSDIRYEPPKDLFGANIYSNSANLYYEGKWAEIIEKPLLENEDGSFWYESDFADKKVYRVTLDDGGIWIHRCRLHGSNIMSSYSDMRLDSSFFSANKYCHLAFIENVRSIQKATKEEVALLEACEKAGEFVQKKELSKSIKVNKIKPQIVRCFSPDKECLGFLNEYEFLDLCCQIKEKSLSGYYFVFEAVSYQITNTGRVENRPEGLFEKMYELLGRLMDTKND